MKAIYVILAALCLTSQPAFAQRPSYPTLTLYAAPGDPATLDNATCDQAHPCSPQGAVMVCQNQPLTLCNINLAAGIYTDPQINVSYYKFIRFHGALDNGHCYHPQYTVLRATVPASILVWVQDHATMSIDCVQMDTADGVAGATGISGRNLVIADWGNVIWYP